jgi:hypothetical protein
VAAPRAASRSPWMSMCRAAGAPSGAEPRSVLQLGAGLERGGR